MIDESNYDTQITPIGWIWQDIGNYYGGNSYESKTKTIYVEASNYFSVGTLSSVFTIDDPGDVFVQDYKLMRLSKTEQLPEYSNYLRLEIKTQSLRLTDTT